MLALVFPFVVTAAAALALLVYVALLSRHKKSSSRPLRLVGRVAWVERPLNPEGFVTVDGELWRARLRGGESVARGQGRVRVTGARGGTPGLRKISSGGENGCGKSSSPCGRNDVNRHPSSDKFCRDDAPARAFV